MSAFYTHPLTVSVAYALLHFVWQGFIVGLLLAAVLRGISKARPELRHNVCCAALFCMGLLPIVTAAVHYSLLEPVAAVSDTSAEKSGSAAEPVAHVSSVASPNPQVDPAAISERPMNHSTLDTFQSLQHAIAPWTVGLWLLGVSLCALRLIVCWGRVRKIRRSAVAIAEPAITSLGRRVATRLGIRFPVTILQSALVDVPAVVGFLKPVVLLPVSAITGLGPIQLEALIAHEFAHIRRHDYLINLAQAVIESLLFYHPAVWWISAQIRQEREASCDRLAAELCGDRRVYVEALLSMEELRGVPQLALGASDGSLVQRARRLLRPEVGRTMAAAWPIDAVVLALIVPLIIGVALTFAAEPGATDGDEPKSNQVAETNSDVSLTPAENYLLGRWVGGLASREWIEFRDDRTFQQTLGQAASPLEGILTGTWKVDGGKLVRKFEREPKEMLRTLETTLKITLASDDQLKLRPQNVPATDPADPAATYLRERDEDRPNGPRRRSDEFSEQEHRLLGEWSEGGTMATVIETFQPDGTYLLTSNFGWTRHGRWSLADNTLKLTFKASAPHTNQQPQPLIKGEELRAVLALEEETARYQLPENSKGPLNRPVTQFRKLNSFSAPPSTVAKKSVRQIFKPTTRRSGKSSWTSLGSRPALGDKDKLMALITAYRGDRWPVTFEGEKEPWFQVEMRYGDDESLGILIVSVDESGRRRMIDTGLRRDQPYEVEVRGKKFTITYASTDVAGETSPHVDYATIIVTHDTRPARDDKPDTIGMQIEAERRIREMMQKARITYIEKKAEVETDKAELAGVEENLNEIERANRNGNVVPRLQILPLKTGAGMLKKRIEQNNEVMKEAKRQYDEARRMLQELSPAPRRAATSESELTDDNVENQFGESKSALEAGIE